ncbi:MAG: hypothetical protein ACRCU1_00400 [Alsobacter sp.]
MGDHDGTGEQRVDETPRPVQATTIRASSIVMAEAVVTEWLRGSETPMARRVSQHVDVLGRHMVIVQWGSTLEIVETANRPVAIAAQAAIATVASRRFAGTR